MCRRSTVRFQAIGRGGRNARIRSAGFTLVELMAVVAIVGLLLALTIPAVMAAREAARRADCQNRLKQLGIALHGFHGQYGRFPEGLLSPACGAKGAEVYSPQARLLPFLEQASLFRKLEESAVEDGKNSPPFSAVALTVVPAFVCPSDPVPGGNNFRVCVGPAVTAFPEELEGIGGGAFRQCRPVSAADVTDGLSHTAGMSERRKADPGDGRFVGDEDVWLTGIGDSARPGTDEFVRFCGALSGQPTDFHDYAGVSWLYSGWYHTWYNHAVAPNSRIVDCDSHSLDPIHNGGGGVHKASSDHRGGVNLLLLDGGVRFVADSIDLAVWRAAATRAGGEPSMF